MTGTNILVCDIEGRILMILWTGHVERTNDRDYEIEERYGYLLSLGGGRY